MQLSRAALLALSTVAVAFALAGCTGAEIVDHEEGPIGAVDLVVEASHVNVEAETQTETMVSIRATAAANEEPGDRVRNISVVIDRSGSMTGPVMADAKEAVLELLSELEDDDRVSIVAFGTDVDVILEHQPWGEVNPVKVIAAVQNLQPSGTTNMTEALSTAVNAVYSYNDSESISRVMLLSDGEANNPEWLMAAAESAKAYGVPVTTLGLGAWYNEENLAQIADLTGGHYRFIESSDSIADFFIAEMNALDRVVTRWAVLEITLGPDVTLEHAFGLPATVQQNKVTFELGELSAGEYRDIGLKLKVDAGSNGAHVEMVDARVIWTDALSQGEPRWDAGVYMGLQATDDPTAITASINRAVVEKVERQHAYWQVEQAVQRIKQGFVNEGNALLRQGATRYRNNKSTASPEAAEYDFMVDEAAESLETYEGSDEQLLDLKRVQSTTRSAQGM